MLVTHLNKNHILDSIFDSGLSDFDQNIAFINIYDLENLFDLDKKKRFLEIYSNKEIELARKKKLEKGKIFPNEYVCIHGQI